MAKTYASIHAQIERLRAEAESLRKKEVAGVIARIREAIEHYGITAQELGLSARGPRGERGAPAKRGKSSATAQAKFADGQGNVWGGRGPRPAWLREALAAGRQLEEFAVGGTAAAGGKRRAAKAPQARAPRAANKKAASSQGRRRAATKTALASTTREQAEDAAAESSATE